MNSIREFREKKGLSQVQLADSSGLSLDTIGRYERGSRSPRVSDLEKIASALGCSASDLLNPPQPPTQSPTESWEETCNAWMTAYYELSDRHIAYVSTSKETLLALQRQIEEERAGWLREIKRLRGNGLYLYGGGEFTDSDKFGVKAGAMFVWKVW